MILEAWIGSKFFLCLILVLRGHIQSPSSISFNEVESGHPIQSISHSPNGDKFVVATGSSSACVFCAEGELVIKFIKGDMYIKDLQQTKVINNLLALISVRCG